MGLTTALLCLTAAYGASAGQLARSDRRTVAATGTGAPEGLGIDPAFECGWRGLAYEYAQQLQPFRSAADFAAIFDSLQLGKQPALCITPAFETRLTAGTLCNQSFNAAELALTPKPAKPLPPATAAGTSFYVDPVGGSDGNPGSQQQPFKTVARAVAAARAGAAKPVRCVCRWAGR
jgi:hypothetical protein